MYGAARQATALVGCFVDSNPNPSKFRWQFQRSKRPTGSIGRKKPKIEDVEKADFTVEHDHSVLEFTPATEADYGMALCWAENDVGAQSEPCKFKIVRESPPDPLRNCRAYNVTWEVSQKIFGKVA